jgi:hypothetical protein
MRKYIKIGLFILQSILIFIIIGAITQPLSKNIQKLVLVEKFKNQAVFYEEISTDYYKFYRIESEENKKAFRKTNGEYYPGFAGDILVSTQSGINNALLSGFISSTVGGHAGICVDKYDAPNVKIFDNQVIESSGLVGDDECQVYDKYYWIDPNIHSEVIGLRMKTTEEQNKQFVENAVNFLGYPYNFSFIFNIKNSVYCSDLISRCASPLGFNLNKDNGPTTIYDIIVSNDTYIFYYHLYDKDGVRHIYYLD